MSWLYAPTVEVSLSILGKKSTATLHKATLATPQLYVQQQGDSFTSAANEAAHWAFVIREGM